ncbi:glycosyltransferase [Quadrisphaera oryzae]|uniref:glycosyltransferase n=1 Tax=Quadrisphaera TaxID=317661 RepID=UPI0016480630|nr:glycosyltransferase [Quadrisphaera sp. RL12-1S]MBC3763779.1 glycosyltransferase [Quadrisphaera sp. RL12-1S]
MTTTADTLAPRVTIVIPVHNQVAFTLLCLQSIEEAQARNTTTFEVVVVDNASTDGTRELLDSLSGDVRTVRNEENRGFGDACNQGAEVARGEFVLFLNNDTAVTGDWLDVLVAAMDEDARRGAVQPKLLYPDGRVNDAGGLVFRDGVAVVYGKGHLHPSAPELDVRRAPDYASGACLLVRSTAFREIGGFDHRYAPAYYEDTDLSFALRAAGWTVLYEPAAVVIHVEGATAGTDTTAGFKAHMPRNQRLFAEKWADELRHRPAFTPEAIDAWAHRPQAGWGPGESAEATTEGLRVLVLDPFPPMYDRASGSLRTLEIEKALRALGHAVVHEATGAAPERARYSRHLSRWGIRLHGEDPAAPGPPLNGSTLHRPLHPEDGYDCVVVGPWQTAEHLLPRIRQHFPSAAVVVDSCDLHFVREARGATFPPEELVQRRERELAVYAAADHVLVVSDVERELLRSLLPGVSVSVVGNAHSAVDAPPPAQGRSGVLFVGNANHPPNVDGARWLVEEVWPRVRAHRPDVELAIVGNDPLGAFRAFAQESVIVTGWVPTTRPFLDAARASVAPLLSGAGVKGKVGEALAAGLPVVATSIGAEGLGLTDGVDVAVADGAAAFAERVLRLLDDDDAWSAQSAAGLHRSREALGPDRLTTDVRTALEAAATAHAKRPRPVVFLVDSDERTVDEVLRLELSQRSGAVLHGRVTRHSPQTGVIPLFRGPQTSRAVGDDAVAEALGQLVRQHAVDVVVFAGLGTPDHLNAHLVETAQQCGAVAVVTVDHDDTVPWSSPGGGAGAEGTDGDLVDQLLLRSASRALGRADVLVLPSAATQLAQQELTGARARLACGPLVQWWPAVLDVLGDLTPPPAPSEVGGPEISVVISTFDRPDALARALEGFCRQTLPSERFEVVVVDDASSVPAAPVAERFTDRLSIRCVRRELNGGVGPARATGVELARGAVVLCFDDDLEPRPRLLAEHLRSHRANPAVHDVVLGFLGAGRGLTTSNVTYAVTQTLQTYTGYRDLTDGQSLPWHYAWGGCSSYKTELLRQHGLRMPWMEDMELAWRLRDHGLRVVFNRHAAMVFDDEMTIEGFCARSAKHGRAQVAISTLHDAQELVRHFGLDDLQARHDAMDDARLQKSLSTAEALVGIPRTVLRASPVRGGAGSGRSGADVLDEALGVVFEQARLAAAVGALRGAGGR